MLTLKDPRLRKFKCPGWMNQKRVQRVGIATITAVFAFCVGELFSAGGGLISQWNMQASLSATCAFLEIVQVREARGSWCSFRLATMRICCVRGSVIP
jgi:hypothetical protein